MVNVYGIDLPLLLFAAVPIGTASLLIFLERLLSVSRMQKNLMHIIAFLGAFIDIVLAYLLCHIAFSPGGPTMPIRENVLIPLEADMVSLFFILIFTTVHFAVTIYCINFMVRFDELPRFYALLLSVVAGLNLIVLVNDYFALFVAWEAMVLCAYAMVGFYRDKEASEAGFKYLMMSSMGSVIVLYGVALLYGILGAVDFATIGSSAQTNNLLLTIAIIVIILGFGITAAMFFLNTWLPDAHPAAPPPAHAMLSGIIVIGGTYGILRTLMLVAPLDLITFVNPGDNLGNWNYLLIFIGIFTSLQGNLFAIIQLVRTDPKGKNLKRILAFSTISHMGYLIVGLGAGNLLGLAGTLFHALNHALAKGILFMITGFLIVSTGTYYLDFYKGLGRRDPLIGTCLVIGFGSLASIPLTSGFWSKLQLVLALFDENLGVIGIIAGILMLVFTFFAAVGYLWIIKFIVFDKSDQEQKYIDGFDKYSKNWRYSWSMKTAIVFLTIITVIAGLFPGPFIDLAISAASFLLPA
ncbi:MAG: complex I subunit 5 family protein [Candidatus Odinarchaeota archaeon]